MTDPWRRIVALPPRPTEPRSNLTVLTKPSPPYDWAKEKPCPI